jgi:hypothetical protein
MPAFFDTNVIRYLRTGLTEPLPNDLRNRVYISPISASELISQIAIEPEAALASVHAFDRWLNPEHAVLLEWYESFYANRVFEIEFRDLISEHLGTAINRCFALERATDDVVEDATELRQFLIAAKRRKAELLAHAVDRIREMRVRPADIEAGARRAIAAGIAERIQAPVNHKTEDEVARCLSAYFEFHEDLVSRAVAAVEFNFFSPEHLNDHFDAEQLLYLADANLHFITADLGYRRVRDSPQSDRIHVLSAADLQAPNTADALIADVLAVC